MNTAGPATPTPAPTPTPNPIRPLRWHGRLAARLIWGAVSLLAATQRWRVRDDNPPLLFGPGSRQPVIFAIWHNRLALCLPIYSRHVRGRTRTTRRMAALVSASRDGSLLARVLEHFDAVPVRGSSSRRGAAALRDLVGAARAGHDLAITPDGPRGPRYQPQPGVIALAQLTGLPIVPVTISLGAKYTLNTWDRFQIPLPFSRCHVCFQPAIHVPATASEPERADFLRQLSASLQPDVGD